MAEWVSYVIGLALVFLTVTAGSSIAQAQAAKSSLARIASIAANEMAVEGGYTQNVQQTIIADLQQDGFDPAQANVELPATVQGVRQDYGNVMTIEIAYPVPVRIVDVSAGTVAVSDTEGATSMYVPGSPADNDPILAYPGQGTADLQGGVQTTAGTFLGP